MSETTAATSGLGRFERESSEELWRSLAELRTRGEVVWDEEIGGWLVFSFDLIKQMSLADNDVFRSFFVHDPLRPRLGMTEAEWIDFIGPSPKALPLLEGPEYDRAHRWYFRALSPKLLARWGETLVEPIAHAQIDRFADLRGADLIAAYADRMASRTGAAILGLPSDDEFIGRFLELHARRTALIEHHLSPNPDPGLLSHGRAARKQMIGLLLPHVRERAGGGDADVISMIWRDGEQLFGDEFDEIDVASTVAALLGSGSGTTAAAVGNSLYLLLTDPALKEQVTIGGVPAVHNLAEEALRLHSPISARFRWATRDTELGGVQIKQGDLVMPVSAVGNRDPNHYPHPDKVDLNRRAPRDHLGFSLGPRTCPGQSLARFQLEKILSVALARLPGMRLDPNAEPPRFVGTTMRRWKPLHAIW